MMRGFSTLELLIAFAIISTNIVGLTILVATSSQTTSNAPIKSTAFDIAVSSIGEEFQLASQNFLSVISISTTTTGIYAHSIAVQLNPDGVTKNISSTVQWKDGWNTIHILRIPAIVTDTAEQHDTGQCLFDSSKGLFQFHQAAFVLNDLLPQPMKSGVYHAQNLYISSSTLFAFATTTLSKTDPDLFIFGVSSSSSPIYTGSVNTSPTTRSGINAIAVNGTYAYIANATNSNFSTCKTGPSCSQLQIIDLHNPQNPLVITNYQLATSTSPHAGGSGGQSSAKSVTYSMGRIYLGLTKGSNSQSDEFNIIDVTNPNSPTWLGGYYIGRTVNKIRIRGAYAYVATDGPQEEILVLNISNPSNIVLVSSFTAPGNPLYGYGKDIDFVGPNVLLGRSYAQGSYDLLVLNPQNSFGTINSEIQASSSNPVSVVSMLVHNSSAYVLTSQDIEFWNHMTDTNPNEAYSLVISSTTLQSLACDGSTLYIGSLTASDSTEITTLQPA